MLSRLLLLPGSEDDCEKADTSSLMEEVGRLSRTEFDNLTALAEINHVLIRGIGNLRGIADRAGDRTRKQWADIALAQEQSRIDIALSFLSRICDAFSRHQIEVAVIKSLDHLPDLGSDLDLYTDAIPRDVIRLMEVEFDAHLASRSWGDRLARKWNFIVPGLPELVEIHMGRLGQTGEQSIIARSLLKRTRLIQVEGRSVRVPSISERLMISTLQRMYRHFYFRLCDIVDSAQLVENRSIDWVDIYNTAKTAGIWEGVATYLAIISDYVNSYRGTLIGVPQWILSEARFRGKEIYFSKDFLRVPVLPQSALLYGTQLAFALRRHQIQNSARLSLLPWLATAALVGQKITGSDKGVW
jgi:hypothetical protein